MKRIEAVLFDLDGVLIDSSEVWFPLLNQVAKDLDYPEITFEQFRAGWGQGVAADVRDFYPGSTVADIAEEYAKRFGDFKAQLRITEEAAPVFERLQREGLGVAVVTNTPGTLARSIVQVAGLSPHHVIGADDVPRAKPHPDMLLEACRRLQVEPNTALMVGDTSYDRRAARAAEVDFAIYVGYEDHSIEGERRITSLSEVFDRYG